MIPGDLDPCAHEDCPYAKYGKHKHLTWEGWSDEFRQRLERQDAEYERRYPGAMQKAMTKGDPMPGGVCEMRVS